MLEKISSEQHELIKKAASIVRKGVLADPDNGSLHDLSVTAAAQISVNFWALGGSKATKCKSGCDVYRHPADMISH